MKKLTYGELLAALFELSPEQLSHPVLVAHGRKLMDLSQVALSCECSGPAVALVGENYPLLIK